MQQQRSSRGTEDTEDTECDFEVHAGTANFCGRYRQNGSLRGFPSYEKVDDKERFIPRGRSTICQYIEIIMAPWLGCRRQ